MAHQDTLNQLKQKFSSNEQWQEFLSFIDSYKIRGCAQELWLQWEIHLLKCQSDNTPWQSQDGRFIAPEKAINLTQFQ